LATTVDLTGDDDDAAGDAEKVGVDGVQGGIGAIPCPSGYDPEVFYALPVDVQQELTSK
jgi:hypothetical protein